MKAHVQVMWFVGIPAGYGHPTCLPWFSVTDKPPAVLRSQARTVSHRGFMIRKNEDLEKLRRGDSQNPAGPIRLRPIPDLLRSRPFLQDVAELAKSLSTHVELEGSILAHAYYLLRKAGVRVVCSDPLTPEAKRQHFGKLVRDLIPVRIQSRGEKTRLLRLTGQELVAVLKAKAVEEALELFWSETPENCKEEIADLREVLLALVRQEGLTEQELDQVAQSKRQERGGFDQGIVLKETEEVPLMEILEEPGLFDGNEVAEGPSGETLVGESTSSIGPRPRVQGNKLKIPLIPPDTRRRHFSRAFELKGFGVTANVIFGEKEVEIEFAPTLPEKTQIDSKQLNLFDR
jgi:predicted house-cleaning noncanonical NTP pyrophosphatase (MazG superfamily)